MSSANLLYGKNVPTLLFTSFFKVDVFYKVDMFLRLKMIETESK